MIELAKAFVTTDGSTFAELAKAQEHEICTIVPGIDPADAQKIVEFAESVVDALTMKENSRPKARKIHGATRTKKAAKKADAAQPELGAPAK